MYSWLRSVLGRRAAGGAVKVTFTEDEIKEALIEYASKKGIVAQKENISFDIDEHEKWDEEEGEDVIIYDVSAVVDTAEVHRNGTGPYR